MPEQPTKQPTLEIPPEYAIHSVNLKDKHAILKAYVNPPEIVHRVVRCTGGFGCNPASLGRAVFVSFLTRDHSDRYDRGDIERLATPEEVEEAEQFVATHGFDAVCAKAERGYRLLLELTERGRVARLLHHYKRTGEHRLVTYECNLFAWSVVASVDSPDVHALLKSMNAWQDA